MLELMKKYYEQYQEIHSAYVTADSALTASAEMMWLAAKKF